VAASGDNGAGTLYPSASPNVLTVGGTTLNLTTSGTIISESGWSGSGGGYSSVEGEPSYQSSAGISDPSGKRGVPDVAYDADPNTGYYVYDSNYYGLGGLWAVGGTSAGAPQWAALVAIADQGRRLAGNVSLDGASQTLPALYQHPADFHDITSGSNGAYSAHSGWDPVTGLGSPIANKLIPDLAAVAGNF
jgi:subtilase family serine protease